jgi:hypothetical protein
MQHKTNRVKALLDQVVQLVRSLSTEHIMKLKTYLINEIEDLVHDSLREQTTPSIYEASWPLNGLILVNF